MARPKAHLKTKMQTALVVTYLREKGPSSKSDIMNATGIDSKRFSNMTQSWRNNPNNEVPFKYSGNKKGALWWAHEVQTPSSEVIVTKTVEKIVEVPVEVPVANLDALSCAISVVNIMQFMNDNGITTMRFGNGLVAELAGDNGINFIRE